MKTPIQILAVFFCAIVTPAVIAQPIGIPSNRMDYSAASQVNSQWCWAASIQMVMNYYGVNVSQRDVVARSFGMDPFGNLPNWAGNVQVITANLNGWGFDANGRRYAVTCQFTPGAPMPTMLIRELGAGRPVIIGYRGPSGGHAVVVTAVDVVPSPQGPIINSITVRDPWPSDANVANRGRAIYGGAALASVMTGAWFVSVQN